MAVVQVMANGNAPSGLSVGDYVNTAGGMYRIANPGDFGATYNSSSGYWSTKADASYNPTSSSGLDSFLSSAQKVSQDNSGLSQNYAREQMQFQTEANAKAMAFSKEEAEKNRQWQERMSNTAHQREMADLIAAGLNPVLTAMGGNGAAVTSGATASGVTSGGASGATDNSFSSLLSSLLPALLNRETTLDVAKINALASQYMADSSRSATLGAAATSALGALRVAQANNAHDSWRMENYPSGITQSIGSLVKGLTDIFSGNFNSSKNPSVNLLDSFFNSTVLKDFLDQQGNYATYLTRENRYDGNYR